MNIILTANSPGEISGWAEPLVCKIKELNPRVKIYIVLLPCSFATGFEYQIASQIKGICQVILAKEVWRFILTGKKLGSIDKKLSGVIFHLGGDLLYTWLINKRLKYPSYAYIWANKLYDKSFKGYFARHLRDKDRLLAQGIKEEKVIIAGDLLADLFKEDQFSKKSFSKLNITFMPGSRQREIENLLPFFLEVAEIIKNNSPDTEFNLLLSPFLDINKFFSKKEFLPDKKFKGIKVIVSQNKKQIISENQTKVDLVSESHYEVLAQADLVITIPGTKTGQAGLLGIPMIMILPLNRPELIPWIGIIGWLDWLGPLGKAIKRPFIKRIADKSGFLSQPNLLAQKEVVPELKGVLTPEQVADCALEILKSPVRRADISSQLKEIYLPLRGAADKVSKKLLSHIGVRSVHVT